MDKVLPIDTKPSVKRKYDADMDDFEGHYDASMDDPKALDDCTLHKTDSESELTEDKTAKKVRCKKLSNTNDKQENGQRVRTSSTSSSASGCTEKDETASTSDTVANANNLDPEAINANLLLQPFLIPFQDRRRLSQCRKKDEDDVERQTAAAVADEIVDGNVWVPRSHKTGTSETNTSEASSSQLRPSGGSADLYRMDKSNIKFLVCVVGIFLSYSYFAILQEKITRSRYGDELNEDGTRGELYTMTLTLVFVQFFVNWCFAKAMLIAKPQKEDKTNIAYYASAALTYLLAMVSSNMALRWVPYPTQVVGKSAKPIPVMILGVLIGNKKYSVQKYVCIVLIVIGVCLFMYKDGKSNAGAGESSFGIGEILLILSLSMDGLLGAIQERIRSASQPSAQQMMLAMNGWSTIMTAVAIICTWEIVPFIEFTSKYPFVWLNLGLLALTGAIGQLFIFMMVSAFGPLSCSVVTTTRKFFTLLTSVILFGNVLAPRQWIGAILVFVGLFADMFMPIKHLLNIGNVVPNCA